MFCANIPPQVFSLIQQSPIFGGADQQETTLAKTFSSFNDDNVTLVTMIDWQSGKPRRS